MKKKTYVKEIFRSIGRTKTRFFSIMIIIAIGVGFFAGINATEPDMVLSADKYYKDTNLSDFRIYNPLGFAKEDLDIIRNVEGIKKVQEGFYKDVFLTTESGNTYTVRLYSYNPEDYQREKGLNILNLKEGKFPDSTGEMVIEAGKYAPKDISVGQRVQVRLPEGEKLSDSIRTDAFQVVGSIESPLYISFERGQTTIGDGSISFYGYINMKDFAMEEPNEVYIETEESDHLVAYSEEYEEHLKPIQDALETLGVQAVSKEKENLWSDLEDAKRELEEGKREADDQFADALNELIKAENDLEKAEQELKSKETRAWKEIEDAEKELNEGREKLEEGWREYNKGYEEWEKGLKEYERNLDEINKAKVQLDENRPLIEKYRPLLAEMKHQLENGKNQITFTENALKSLGEFQQILTQNPPTQKEDFKALVEQKILFPNDLKQALLEYSEVYSVELIPLILNVTGNAYDSISKELVQAKEEFEKGKAELLNLEKKINEYEQGLIRYNEGIAQLESAKRELDIGKVNLDKIKAELEANEQKILNGESELKEQRERLTKTFKDAWEELNKGKAEVEEGWEKFNREKEDVYKELEEPERDIRKAEKNLKNLPSEWFVSTREGNPGYAGYGDDANRIGAVAKVFPLFFFLVAALVCLTTMTRMVEEERGQIGILKALGYKTGTIATKYIIYAFLSSFSGAILGLVIGYPLFPSIIMNAYGIMYTIPDRVIVFHWDYAIYSIIMALVTTTVAALMSTLQELKATPAILMQPKAPKPGKRIFLERITPLWSRLSFSRKVTFRNIFRYKKRFFMTVFGIAGCTALLITGFGLRDSINDIMGKQFDEIFLYDGQLVTNIESSQEKERLLESLRKEERIDSFLPIFNETVETRVKGKNRFYEANLMVPESLDHLNLFIDLHTRLDQRKIELPKQGAIITEKLANLLGISPGDSVTLRTTEGTSYDIVVADIAENYLTHYIYLSPEYYEEVTGDTYQANSVLFNEKKDLDLDEKEFKESLMENEHVLAVVLLGTLKNQFHDTLKSLDFVILVLIISAGALAMVVLYNLTNINITERIREIATIKVLGFRDGEVDSYIYRENVILTLFGTLLGLVLGLIFHRYVIHTMEIDSMMFGQNVHLVSYIWSVLLTFGFSAFVNFFMHFSLKRVNMVESLKSVE